MELKVGDKVDLIVGRSINIGGRHQSKKKQRKLDT
jgi:hypothetical protein